MTDQTKEMEVQKQEVITTEDVERTRDCPCYIPRSDIYESNDDIVVLMDLPGADENAVHINLEKNILTVNAYITPNDVEGYGQTYSEYEVGDFERSFTISDEIDRDNIAASIRNGVLRLTLPKAGPAKTRTITVNTA